MWPSFKSTVNSLGLNPNSSIEGISGIDEGVTELELVCPREEIGEPETGAEPLFDPLPFEHADKVKRTIANNKLVLFIRKVYLTYAKIKSQRLTLTFLIG